MLHFQVANVNQATKTIKFFILIIIITVEAFRILLSAPGVFYFEFIVISGTLLWNTFKRDFFGLKILGRATCMCGSQLAEEYS